MGKTVLLSDFARAAAGRDWITAKIEAGSGKALREVVGEALHGSLADLAQPNAGVSQDTWNEAHGSPITHTDARVGAAIGRAALDSGFFRARWDRATRVEQRYLRAMAADGDSGSWSGAVAERLGKKPTSLGPTRASLIVKGLVYAPEHGVVAFTVPSMAAFIQRQPEEESNR